MHIAFLLYRRVLTTQMFIKEKGLGFICHNEMEEKGNINNLGQELEEFVLM